MTKGFKHIEAAPLFDKIIFNKVEAISFKGVHSFFFCFNYADSNFVLLVIDMSWASLV